MMTSQVNIKVKVIIDNIHSVHETSVDLEEGNMADDDITGQYKGQGHHR